MFAIAIILLLICCILSMSSLVSFGSKIPYVQDYKSTISSVSSSAIFILAILSAISLFFMFNPTMVARRKLLR